MQRVWVKETVFLETSDSLLLLGHNYACSNFIGQYLAGYFRLNIRCSLLLLSIPMVKQF